MADGYSYAVVEKALAEVFGADAVAQKGPFRGRIKHLQRLGLPAGGPGRGQKISYSYAQICDWLIALELEEFGIDPTLAVRMVTGRTGPDQPEGAWKSYLPNVIEKARQSSDSDVLLLVEPYFMSASWRGDRRFDPASFRHLTLAGAGLDEFRHLLAGWGAGIQQRACVFNLSERLRLLDTALQKQIGETP